MKKRGWIRERIIRVLLNEPEGTLTKYRLAKKAECSFSWAHEFLSMLAANRLVSQTKIIDYAGLVNYWRTVRIQPDQKEYMFKNPLALLKKTRMRYALTTYQAENLVQNYLFPSRTDLYILQNDVEQWHELIAGEGFIGKGNVRLLLTDDHVFYKSFERHGLRVVSLPQLIVDLFSEDSIGVEAAEKLLEKVIEGAVPTN